MNIKYIIQRKSLKIFWVDCETFTDEGEAIKVYESAYKNISGHKFRLIERKERIIFH